MSANAWLAELNAARQARQPAVRHTHTLHNGRELVIIQKHGAHLGSSLWHAALPLAHYLHASGLWRRRSGRRVLELGAGCGAAGLAAAISADSAEMPEGEASSPSGESGRSMLCLLYTSPSPRD